MRNSVKTIKVVIQLAKRVADIVGKDLSIFQHADGKVQIMIATPSGFLKTLRSFPDHKITVREAALALEFWLAMNADKVNVSFIGSPAPTKEELIRLTAEKHFNKVVDNIKTQSVLMDCMNSMLNAINTATPDTAPHISATIQRYEWVFTTKGRWNSHATTNVRHFIRAYRKLAMPFITDMYNKHITMWGLPTI